MNFFVLDKNPVQAALLLDDKRVQKIALEVTQVLSVVLLRRGVAGFYKPCHQNHPVTLWAGSHPDNTAWAWRYGMALCGVYRLFGKKPEHACRSVLLAMRPHLDLVGNKTPFKFQNSARNAKYDLDFTHLPVVQAYEQYLLARFPTDKRPPVWTGRSTPKWA